MRFGPWTATMFWALTTSFAPLTPAFAASEPAPVATEGASHAEGRNAEGRGRMERLADHLQLSPEVRAQIAAIGEKNKDALKRLQAKGAAIKAQIEAERLETWPNWKRIGKLLHQGADLKADAALIEMQAMSEMTALLTPEQRAELKRLRDARGSRGDHGPGRRKH